MVSPLRFSLRCFAVFVFSVGCAWADPEPAILGAARAYLGSEAALTAITGLRMVGQLEVTETGGAASTPAQIEILFQQPARQRITATTATQVEVTALDGYDAWQRVADPADTTRWQVSLLGPDQIKRLRANTFENLSFYRASVGQGVRIEDRGAATVDGVACRQVAFIYAPDIVFLRSFEIASGRLVLTQTDSGTEIREEGEYKVAGVRFPKRIVTSAPLTDGSRRTISVIFSSIEVNPTIAPEAFAIPTLSP